MPKKHSDIWNHFIKMTAQNKKGFIVLCKYCSSKYNFPNPTKMTLHISKCPKYNKTEQLYICSETTSSTSSVVTTENPSMIKDETTIPSTPNISKFFDKMPQDDQKQLDQLLSLALYMSNCPFNMFENIYWKNFFQLIRPSYKIPSRIMFSTTLLDYHYEKVIELVTMKLDKSSNMTLISDGWKNLRGEKIINFRVMTPSPLFLGCVNTGCNHHTGEYICKEISNKIEQIGKEKVFAVVTDNAANMNKAWELLKANYTTLECFGCAAHGFNLLLKDICSKNLEIHQFINKAKNIVKHIKCNAILAAVLKDKQLHKGNAVSLKVPGLTNMLESLLANKAILQEMAISESFDDKEIIKTLLDNENFWDFFQTILPLLNIIHTKILQVEGGRAFLSDVVEAFLVIRASLDEGSSWYRRNNLTPLIRKRQHFCCQDLHITAYMLDPRFCGKNMCDKDVIKAFKCIARLCNNMQLNVGKVIGNLAEFRAREGIWAEAGIWASVDYTTPLVWWKGMCVNQAISPLAVRLFSLPPSSTASERIWLTSKNVHTKIKNKLNNDEVRKIVAIRQNLHLINRVSPPDHHALASSDCTDEDLEGMESETELHSVYIPT